jgi:cytochrome P450
MASIGSGSQSCTASSADDVSATGSRPAAVRRDALDFLVDLSRRQGGVVPYRSGAGPAFLVGHPASARYVLLDNSGNYRKVTSLEGDFRDELADGLLTSEGDVWNEQRRSLHPRLHQPNLSSLVDPIVEVVDELIERWNQIVQSGGTVEVASEMVRLALQVTMKALFGQRIRTEIDAIVSVFARPRGLFTPSRKQEHETFKAQVAMLVDQVIQAPSRDGERHADLLPILERSRSPSGTQLAGSLRLRREVGTLLFASATTTGHGLAWTWYLLSQHPEVADHLNREVVAVLGDRPPTAEDLPRLSFTRWILDEALRLYPPGWVIGRQALEDDRIQDRHIPGGSIVAVCPYLIHRHPDFWTEPEAFDPERFSPARAGDRSRFAYLPFGAGPRQCVGNAFALIEAELVIALIARQFRLTLVPGHPVEKERSYILYPRHGVLMTLARGPAG